MELSPESPHFPTTMNELMNRLRVWRSVMQATVEDLHPPFLRLEDESRTLLVREIPCFSNSFTAVQEHESRTSFIRGTPPPFFHLRLSGVLSTRPAPRRHLIFPPFFSPRGFFERHGGIQFRHLPRLLPLHLGPFRKP